MIKSVTFSDIEYRMRKRTTNREVFLDTMEKIIPWDEWVAYIAPHYPKGERGRKPKGIEAMLRMYLLQCRFNLSDEAVEDSIYDSYAMRKFMGISFLDEQAPDATTLLKFRHLLERHQIGEQFFRSINYVMEQNGFIMRGGTSVDATLISAPTSTKNVERKRDPEMHSTKKGDAWHFGMKCHIGVDAGNGLVHTLVRTAANVHDITTASELIREDDTVLYGDSGYLGLEKREEILSDRHKAQIDYRINLRQNSLPRTCKKYELVSSTIFVRKSPDVFRAGRFPGGT